MDLANAAQHAAESEITCFACGSTKVSLADHTFVLVCENCGECVDEHFMHESTKGKSNDGLVRKGIVVDKKRKSWNTAQAGQMAPTGNGLSLSTNRDKYLRRTKERLETLAAEMNFGDAYNDEEQVQPTIETALQIWLLCYDQQMTKGYERNMLLAVCLYMACRETKLPYLLIDFSDFLSLNVFHLAKVFSKLCLQIPYPLALFDLDNPAFIERFAKQLQFGEKLQTVCGTVMHLISQMREDWIVTGRRPSGIVGACLLISARIHGFRRTAEQLENVVGISKHTIRKRLKEFGNTRASKLTINQFVSKHDKQSKGFVVKQAHIKEQKPGPRDSKKMRKMKSSKYEDGDSDGNSNSDADTDTFTADSVGVAVAAAAQSTTKSESVWEAWHNSNSNNNRNHNQSKSETDIKFPHAHQNDEYFFPGNEGLMFVDDKKKTRHPKQFRSAFEMPPSMKASAAKKQRKSVVIVVDDDSDSDSDNSNNTKSMRKKKYRKQRQKEKRRYFSKLRRLQKKSESKTKKASKNADSSVVEHSHSDANASAIELDELAEERSDNYNEDIDVEAEAKEDIVLSDSSFSTDEDMIPVFNQLYKEDTIERSDDDSDDDDSEGSDCGTNVNDDDSANKNQPIQQKRKKKKKKSEKKKKKKKKKRKKKKKKKTHSSSKNLQNLENGDRGDDRVIVGNDIAVTNIADAIDEETAITDFVDTGQKSSQFRPPIISDISDSAMMQAAQDALLNDFEQCHNGNGNGNRHNNDNDARNENENDAVTVGSNKSANTTSTLATVNSMSSNSMHTSVTNISITNMDAPRNNRRSNENDNEEVNQKPNIIPDSLSDLDDDREINHIVLNSTEAMERDQIFLTKFPDWPEIQAGIVRRAKEKQEKEERRNLKRKMLESYEYPNDSFLALSKHISKKFKTGAIDPQTVALILGADTMGNNNSHSHQRTDSPAAQDLNDEDDEEFDPYLIA